MAYAKRFKLPKLKKNEKLAHELQKVPSSRWDFRDLRWSFEQRHIFLVADAIETYLPKLANILRKSPKYETHRKLGSRFKNILRIESMDSRAKTAEIAIPAPKGQAYRPFQKAGAAWIVAHDNSYLGDEPGLGKTIQSIAAINYLGLEKCLFIVPAFLKINWERELRKWLVKKIPIYNINNQFEKVEEFYRDRGMFIVNYDILETFRHHLRVNDWGMVTIDEAHYIKNPDTQRSRNTRMCVEQAARIVELSGTPIKNRIPDLWNPFNLLRPDLFPDYDRFIGKYMIPFYTDYGKTYSPNKEKYPELRNLLRSEIMIRRKKSDVFRELPPKTRQIIEIPKSGKYSRLLKKEEKYTKPIRELLSKSQTMDSAAFSLALRRLRAKFESDDAESFAQIRQEVALAKVPDVVKFAKECLESTDKIILYAHHHSAVDAYAKAFGKKAVVVKGGMNEQKRQDSIDRFQNDPEVQVFIGTIGTAVGYTITAGHYEIFAEVGWDPSIMEQAEDRAHRMGQTKPLTIYLMLLEDSADYLVASTMAIKDVPIKAVVDG